MISPQQKFICREPGQKILWIGIGLCYILKNTNLVVYIVNECAEYLISSGFREKTKDWNRVGALKGKNIIKQLANRDDSRI
uniref:Uncharacterized protein n=1 Tax=Heterorhabditis bacteriophora TaxID=37862 RepID=A0A1I7XGI2_HETBA